MGINISLVSSVTSVALLLNSTFCDLSLQDIALGDSPKGGNAQRSLWSMVLPECE